jgi:multidrug efflux system membrane fusion protein
VRWIAALAILAIFAAAGGVAWWFMARPPQQAAAPPPMKVPTITAIGETVPIYRSFPATTQAMRIVSIQARVTGYLVQQGAADGEDVASGALLYRIDPKDYQAAFEQAQASLAQANASLQYSRVSQGRNQILAHQGWVSQDTSDQANSTFHQGQASLANSDAAVKEAALNLSRTEIRAPFAGRISASQVFEGSLISVAGATLNTLVQLDPIYVSFNPAEVNLPAIAHAQERAPIETVVSQNGGAQNGVPRNGEAQNGEAQNGEAQNGEAQNGGGQNGVSRNGGKPDHIGTLTFIDNQVSLSTGTILLRATIANPDHALLPGQYVTATLHLGDLRDAVLVPQSAVGSTQIGRTLMIVGDGNKVEQRLVKLGDNDGDRVIVTDGLKPGERVVTGQLQKLKPGAVVQPDADPQ